MYGLSVFTDCTYFLMVKMYTIILYYYYVSDKSNCHGKRDLMNEKMNANKALHVRSLDYHNLFLKYSKSNI